MSMAIQELIEKVAEELPAEWSLRIAVTGGVSAVSVRTPLNVLCFGQVTSNDRDVESTVLDALSHAQAEARR